MKKNLVKIYTVAVLGVMLTGCLDDNKYALDPSTTNNVVEFLDPSVPISPAGSVYPAWIRAFPIDQGDQVFEQEVSFSGPNGNGKNIDLTVEVDPFSLYEYNTQQTDGLNGGDALHGPTFELLPADHYDIESLEVTIPKGSKTAVITVTVHPLEFDLSKKYALPLRIVSASSGVLSGHFSTGIFAVVIKNQYDAAYKASIWTTGWQAYAIYNSTTPLAYPNPGIGLATTGPNSNQLQNLYRGDNLLPGYTDTGGATGFGDASPVFEFDEDTTPVDIDNNPATPDVAVHKIIGITNGITPFAPRFRDFAMNPAAAATDNWFNPANRSMNANFLFKQSGRPDMTNYWKLTFTSERP